VEWSLAGRLNSRTRNTSTITGGAHAVPVPDRVTTGLPWLPGRPLTEKSMRSWRTAGVGSLGVLALLSVSTFAAAQYPPPQGQPQPYPYPPYPQPPPAQPAPSPYPAPQPYPAPYPQQPQPYPPAYGQPPYPAPYGQPGYAQPPYAQPGYGPAYPPYSAAPPAPQRRLRSYGEMAYLYGVGAAYGFGTGVWLDSLGHVKDPGLWVIAPIALGVAAPIGGYFWDRYDELDRGVPSSIATGLLLGGIEGVAVGGLQWQLTGRDGPDTWAFSTQTSVTFLTATAGGVGGYLFGEWLRPDPRSLGLIASGAGFGTAFGVLFGTGVDGANGAAAWGFAGYNAGILATGILATQWVPSWQTLKYMWLGDTLGTLATTPVYLFYIGSSADPRHGLIANALGGVAGLAVAAALTANLKDLPTGHGSASASPWTPPFQVAFSPMKGGAALTAMGSW
jgi:hypothetical protein